MGEVVYRCNRCGIEFGGPLAIKASIAHLSLCPTSRKTITVTRIEKSDA